MKNLVGLSTKAFGGLLGALISISVYAAAPTVSVQRFPSPMVAGQNQTSTWATTNATSLSYNCTASGTGFAGTGTVPINGTSTGVASAAWVGYPSNCTWTATGPGGSATFPETLTTVNPPPLPSFSIQRTPSPMVAGQSQTATWTTANATSLSFTCTASGTGFTGSATIPVNSSSTSVASAGWVGYPSNCVYTATGPGGSATFSETLTTVTPPPTFSVQRTPSPMVAGQNQTSTWTTTNATSLSYSCSASGTGYTGSATVASVNGSTTGTASAAWIGYPSNCTWTATGPGGSRTFPETLTTVPPPPTINVQRTPSPVVAGQNYTSTWTTTDATSLSYSCSASGTGYAGSATVAVNGSNTTMASAAWVGYPSACTWTAIGPGGSKTYSETLTTATPPPTFSIQRTPSPMVAGQNQTGTWTTTNATSLSFTCTAGGTGFTGSATIPVNSSSTSVASADWVGYPSNCVYTATGPGGSATFSETLTTVTPPPTFSVQRTPSPMVAGQNQTSTWTTTNATSLSYNCSASGTGYTGSATVASVNGSTTGIASAAWVGYPSNCTWTATGPGGSRTFPETLTTVPPPPTINVQRTPSPVVAGQNYTSTWTTTDATSLSYSCSASGTGYAGSATVAVNGSNTTMASAAWVGYPSTCTWTAIGPGGSAIFPETLTTVNPPLVPTFSIQRTPSPMIAGQSQTATWTTTNATSLSFTCTASSTGFTGSATIPVNSSSTSVASADWVGYPSNCVYTATGPGGSATFQETLTTVTPLPTFSIQRIPSPMVAGLSQTSTWTTTNATSLSYNCTAGGSGYVGSATVATVNGSSTGIASTDWVGNPSACTWTATGPGGSANFPETLTTVNAPVPTFSIKRVPSPMIAGLSQTSTWTTTNATSLSYACTASNTGYVGAATAPVNGSNTGVASAAWVGFPSTCTWTAIGPGGTKTFNETLTTEYPPQPIVAWTGLVSALDAGDQTRVLTYFSNPSKYEAILTAIGPEGLKKISPTLSDIRFIEVTPDYATAAVTQTITQPTGVTKVSVRYISLTFVDGTWHILDF